MFTYKIDFCSCARDSGVNNESFLIANDKHRNKTEAAIIPIYADHAF